MGIGAYPGNRPIFWTRAPFPQELAPVLRYSDCSGDSSAVYIRGTFGWRLVIIVNERQQGTNLAQYAGTCQLA